MSAYCVRCGLTPPAWILAARDDLCLRCFNQVRRLRSAVHVIRGLYYADDPTPTPVLSRLAAEIERRVPR